MLFYFSHLTLFDFFKFPPPPPPPSPTTHHSSDGPGVPCTGWQVELADELSGSFVKYCDWHRLILYWRKFWVSCVSRPWYCKVWQKLYSDGSKRAPNILCGCCCGISMSMCVRHDTWYTAAPNANGLCTQQTFAAIETLESNGWQCLGAMQAQLYKSSQKPVEQMWVLCQVWSENIFVTWNFLWLTECYFNFKINKFLVTLQNLHIFRVSVNSAMYICY